MKWLESLHRETGLWSRPPQGTGRQDRNKIEKGEQFTILQRDETQV